MNEHLVGLSNEALLCCIVGPQAAQSLTHTYPSLTAIAQASPNALLSLPGMGGSKSKAVHAALMLAERLSHEALGEYPLCETPDSVASLLREEARVATTENFKVLLLNTRRRLIKIVDVATGTLDTILVHPREVFRAAIEANAAAILLVHNHPSRCPDASESDVKVTRDLIRAGQLLKIEVLDHVILGRATQERPKDYVSLRELGYFYS